MISKIGGLFSFLGNLGNIIITCIIAIVTVICIVIMLKYESSRKFLIYVLGGIIIIIGVFSTIRFTNERLSKSYVNGSIDITNKFTQETFNYSSSSLVLYHDNYDDTNTYTFSKELLKTKDFNGLEKTYKISLNKYLILNANINAGSIYFVFITEFYNVENELLCNAKINISIMFLNEKTQLTVSIIGKTEAEFTEQYFKDNGFRLSVVEILEGENNV